jgi:hypothetical protein
MTTPQSTSRVVLTSVVAPLIVTVVVSVLMFSWVGDLPDPAAVHWTVAGNPDGYGAPRTLPILFLVVSLSLVALLGGATVVIAHHSPLTRIMKVLAVSVPGVVVFLAVVLGGSMAAERGASSWRDAEAPGLVILWAIIATAVVITASWFLLPPGERAWQQGEARAVPALRLKDGERASWHANAAASVGLVIASVAACAVAVAATTIAIVLGGIALWPLSLLPLVVLVFVLATLNWTIRVDARGVLARSALGLPRVRIALADVESAEVVQIDPFRQFGGWGIRFGLNRDLGIVLRSGEGLRVVRKSGRSLVISVNDAASAAGLLNALSATESAAQNPR